MGQPCSVQDDAVYVTVPEPLNPRGCGESSCSSGKSSGAEALCRKGYCSGAEKLPVLERDRNVGSQKIVDRARRQGSQAIGGFHGIPRALAKTMEGAPEVWFTRPCQSSTVIFTFCALSCFSRSCSQGDGSNTTRRRNSDTWVPHWDNTRIERDVMAWISQRRQAGDDPRLMTSPAVLRRREPGSRSIPAPSKWGDRPTGDSPCSYHQSILETTPTSPPCLLEPAPRIIAQYDSVVGPCSCGYIDSSLNQLGTSPVVRTVVA